MQSRVGARLEVAPKKRTVLTADTGWILVLMAFSVALHGWIISRTTVTARDSIGFARIALNLGSPNHGRIVTPGVAPRSFMDVFRESVHPPAYPLSVLVTSFGVRQVMPEGDLPNVMIRSTQITSAIAAVLMVVPVYWLGRNLFEKRFAAFSGAALFQCAPSIAHMTSDGLAESLYLLFVASALSLGVAAFREFSVGKFLLCGIAIGMSYLVRPEGLMVLLAFGGVLAGIGILGKRPRDAVAGRMIALGVGVLLIAIPYMVLIGGLTNKPTANEALNRLMNGNPRASLFKGDVGAAPASTPGLFADWYNAERDGNQAAWASIAIMKETSKAAHYLPALLAIVALGLFRSRIVRDPALASIVFLGIINVCVLQVLAIKVGYVSERHTVVLVLLCCVLTGGVLDPLLARLSTVSKPTRYLSQKVGPIGMLVLLLATAIPVAMRTPHDTRSGHKYAGEYLRSEVGSLDAVIDPYSWAEWYAGRSLYTVPADPEVPLARWVVIEGGKSPHSRLPRFEAAVNVVNDTSNKAELKYWWPTDGTPENAKVLVYRQPGDGT